MAAEDVEIQLRLLMEETEAIGLQLDEARAREVVQGLVARAEEHDVSVETIKARNMMRELFGGEARP